MRLSCGDSGNSCPLWSQAEMHQTGRTWAQQQIPWGGRGILPSLGLTPPASLAVCLYGLGGVGRGGSGLALPRLSFFVFVSPWWSLLSKFQISSRHPFTCFFVFVFNLLIGEGNGNPLQYSFLGNPMDTGAWKATVHRVTQSRTRLKRLGTRTFI